MMECRHVNSVPLKLGTIMKVYKIGVLNGLLNNMFSYLAIFINLFQRGFFWFFFRWTFTNYLCILTPYCFTEMDF